MVLGRLKYSLKIGRASRSKNRAAASAPSHSCHFGEKNRVDGREFAKSKTACQFNRSSWSDIGVDRLAKVKIQVNLGSTLGL